MHQVQMVFVIYHCTATDYTYFTTFDRMLRSQQGIKYRSLYFYYFMNICLQMLHNIEEITRINELNALTVFIFFTFNAFVDLNLYFVFIPKIYIKYEIATDNEMLLFYTVVVVPICYAKWRTHFV